MVILTEKMLRILIIFFFACGTIATVEMINGNTLLKYTFQSCLLISALMCFLIVKPLKGYMALSFIIVFILLGGLVSGVSELLLHFATLFMLVMAIVVHINRRYLDYSFLFYNAAVGVFLVIIPVMVLSLSGILDNNQVYVSTINGYKSTLGFFNPNITGLVSVGLVLSALLSKSTWQKSLSIFIFFIVIYYCVPRTSILIFTVIIILASATTICSPRTLVCLVQLLCVQYIVIIFLMILVKLDLNAIVNIRNGNMFEFINGLMSGRLSIAYNKLLDTSFLHLLLPGGGYKNIDFSWYNILIGFGGPLLLIYFILVIARVVNMRADELNISLIALGAAFVSLFGENALYSYFILGVTFVLPFVFCILPLRHRQVPTAK